MRVAWLDEDVVLDSQSLSDLTFVGRRFVFDLGLLETRFGFHSVDLACNVPLIEFKRSLETVFWLKLRAGLEVSFD